MFYYVGYNFFIVLASLILVSLVAFFHFLLDHRLGIIEEWIFKNSYQILLLSKVLAFAGILVFVNVHSGMNRTWLTILKKGALFPQYKIFVVSFLQICVIVFLGSPQWNEQSDIVFLNLVVSFVGTILFYFIDVFLLVILDNIIPVAGRSAFWLNFFYPAIFFVVAEITFRYGSNINGLIFFNSFFCFYLVRMGRSNWTYSLIWLILVAAPTGSLMGMDILWKNTYALFNMTQTIGNLDMFVLVLISIIYLSGVVSKCYNASNKEKVWKVLK